MLKVQKSEGMQLFYRNWQRRVKTANSEPTDNEGRLYVVTFSIGKGEEGDVKSKK